MIRYVEEGDFVVGGKVVRVVHGDLKEIVDTFYLQTSTYLPPTFVASFVDSFFRFGIIDAIGKKIFISYDAFTEEEKFAFQMGGLSNVIGDMK